MSKFRPNIFLICTTLNYFLIGLIFINKVPQKLKFSNNVNNEKCAPKMIFFNEIFF